MTSPDQRALEALVSGEGISRMSPPLLLPANPFFELAGEDFGRGMLLTSGSDGVDYCLRPDFTLPIVAEYLRASPGVRAAFGYLGPIFRQRAEGPAEFEQAGLELLAQPDPDAALDRIFGFARAALRIYGVSRPEVRLGGIALFEAVLAALDLPASIRRRIRSRFGHDQALDRLLERLASPPGRSDNTLPERETVIAEVSAQMSSAGLSPSEGRTPEEIADRFLETRSLADKVVSPTTVTLLRRYLGIAGEAREALDEIRRFGDQAGIDLSGPLASLERHLASLGDDAPVRFEARFSPPLDYYTGIVFEMRGRGGEVLASGGQYDRLLERLGAATRIAASGCAVWVDRLGREGAP